MKHLLTGVAIAAALAISAPAWAQNAPMKPAAAAPAKPVAAKKPPMAKKHVMHRRMTSDDSMTDKLNQQELARIQGGMAPGGPSPSRMPGPKASPN